MPTTGISLVREHTAALQPPRFLWVPFELGRPFGAPHAPDFQRRVLHAALALLERRDGPAVLEDFPDDAPATRDGDEEAWACPVSFRPPPGERPELAHAVLEELARLAPWYELCVEQGGTRSPARPQRLEAFALRLAALARGEAPAREDGEPALPEWLRLGCEELRGYYLDAARGQPGRGSSRELYAWFWRETAAARLIGRAARALLAHDDPLVRLLAARALVPREHQAALMGSEAGSP